MATYCFRCPRCSYRGEFPERADYVCPDCDEAVMVRDWRAEGAQLVIPDEFVNPLPADGPVV